MLRCHDCGREVCADEAVRHNMVVPKDRTVGAAAGQPGSLGTAQLARVDLCPECDSDRAARAAKRNRSAERATLTLVIAASACLGFLFGALFFSAVTRSNPAPAAAALALGGGAATLTPLGLHLYSRRR